MAATTIGAVSDRLHALVTAQGFTLAKDAFDFDRQPSQSLEKCFRIHTGREGTEGYLGGDQMERHTVDIWIARKTKRDPHGAARQLTVDLDLIEAALVRDTALDYWVGDDSVTTEQPEPRDDQDYQVARLSAVVEFDRDV